MPKQSRLGDTLKISCPHGTQVGIITSASKFSYFDNIPCARFTDSCICCSCGGSGNIITGSKFSFTDNLMNARITDKEVGTCQPGCKTCDHSHDGEIVKGSNYSYTDG